MSDTTDGPENPNPANEVRNPFEVNTPILPRGIFGYDLVSPSPQEAERVHEMLSTFNQRSNRDIWGLSAGRPFRHQAQTSISSSPPSDRVEPGPSRRVDTSAVKKEEVSLSLKYDLMETLITVERARCMAKEDPDERDDSLGNLVDATPEVKSRIAKGMSEYLSLLQEDMGPYEGTLGTPLTPQEVEIIRYLREIAPGVNRIIGAAEIGGTINLRLAK